MRLLATIARRWAAAAASLAVAASAGAINLQQVRFHNEATDTTAITAILVETQGIADPGERVVNIARRFIGTPYAAHTLEGPEEMLTVNLDSLDCTTFVETVAALAYTAGERRASWRDFVHNLERLRYRSGHLDGYASRLHYISDWIVNNSHRGLITEATAEIPMSSTVIKTIDYMSRHRDAYPALADDDTFQAIKDVEGGYRSHLYHIVKWERTSSRDVINALADGDIIALTCSAKDLDVSHMAILVKVDGKPHLIHASSSAGRVELSKLPLRDFLSRNRLTGIRVIRLKQ